MLSMLRSAGAAAMAGGLRVVEAADAFGRAVERWRMKGERQREPAVVARVIDLDGPPLWRWTTGRAALHLFEDALTVRVEWTARSERIGASVGVDDGEGAEVKGSVAVRPLALYVSLEGKAVRGLLGGRVETRELSWAVHDGAVWWRVWADPDSWEHDRPRWRDGNLKVVEAILGEWSSRLTVREEREVVVPLPEGSYQAKARLGEYVVTYGRIARWWERRVPNVNMEILAPKGIPIPGKGENAWDCGNDATFSLSTPARSIEEGVAAFVENILRTRMRRAGTWMPPTPETASGPQEARVHPPEPVGTFRGIEAPTEGVPCEEASSPQELAQAGGGELAPGPALNTDGPPYRA